MLAIETVGLRKSFGEVEAVRDVALAVPEGCVYGFLGPNGAGKSTVMRILLGLIQADAGEILMSGLRMPDQRRQILARTGALIESPALYDHLTGAANIELARRLRGLPSSETGRVLEALDLVHAGNRLVGGYSLGMKQRLAIARSMLGSPRLIILDEPTNGLDPDAVFAMRELIRQLPERTGATVFMSSHLLAEVEQVADVIGLMRAGRLYRQARVQDLLGGEYSVEFGLDRVADAAATLTAAGFSVDRTGTASLSLSLSGESKLQERIAAANRELVSAGHAVFSVQRAALSLEQFYRNEMIDDQEVARQ